MTSAPMRTIPTPEQREQVDQLVEVLPGGRPGDLPFDEPWQIRAFALAVAAHETGQFEWTTFQGALVESIGTWERNVETLEDPSWSYYEHWVTALEKVLGGIGSIEPSALEERTQVLLATPANRNHHEPHYDPVAIDPGSRPPVGGTA